MQFPIFELQLTCFLVDLKLSWLRTSFKNKLVYIQLLIFLDITSVKSLLKDDVKDYKEYIV